MQIDVKERQEARKTLFGIRRSAWLEMLLFYGALVLIDVFFLGFSRYWGVNPHPFWLVSLLLACQYGTKEGVIAALIGIIIYLIGPWPEQDINTDRFGYVFAILVQPIFWLVTAVLFGELRQRHIRERSTLEDELESSREREERITQAYEQVKEIKSGLELRTATQIRSSIAAHRAVRTMDAPTEGESLRGLQSLLESVANIQKFSIYLFNEARDMEARATSGWNDGDHYSRTLSPHDPLYRAVLERRKPVTILNADDQPLLAGHGMVATPLVDLDTGEIYGMLKVEGLPFTELNFHTVETIAAAGEMGGKSLSRIRKYQTAKASSMVNPEHGMNSYGFYHRYAEFISSLGKRLKFDVSMLVVRLVGADQLPYTTRLQAAKLFAETVNQSLRKVDMAFDYQQNSEEFTIVLPATSVEGAEKVREKIQTQLGKALRAIDANVRFSYTVEALHAE